MFCLGEALMKVLVVGSGGREHALCWAISKSKKCRELFCAPGNPGINDIATCVDISAEDIDGLVDFSLEKKINYVVIGPEVPLVAGIVDKLEEVGIPSFGPNAKASILEASKGFMKDFCARFQIPTAKYWRFADPKSAKDFVETKCAPLVVKADGLAAGKGVLICRTILEAKLAIDSIMTEKSFGIDAGAEIVVEEFLEGEEASFFALVDGTNVLPMGSAQDHKAAFDGDTGPNTGGMGAYAPAVTIDKAMTNKIMREIIVPTVNGMSLINRPYNGILYAGLMLTNDGPKLIEYNVRFGDPECQPLMMRLKSDVLDVLLACTEGRLDRLDLKWSTDIALVVIMAARGYPGEYKKNTIISNLKSAENVDHVKVFHSGTSKSGKTIVASGGRVLGVTGLAHSVEEARNQVYTAIASIDWPDGFYRTDIGLKAVTK